MELKIVESNIDGEIIQTVNARDLHEFLGIGKDFSTWVTNRIEKYDFVEGSDYTIIIPKFGDNSKRGPKFKEYHISITMAKELAMVENTQKGKEVRKYFIECENKYKKLLKKQVQLEWQEARADGKVIRRETTDAIKRLVDSAKEQGSRSPKRYYSLYTQLLYQTLYSNFEWSQKLPDNFRNKLSGKELMKVGYIEDFLQKIIHEELDKGTYYKDIWNVAKAKLEAISKLTGKVNIPALALS